MIGLRAELDKLDDTVSLYEPGTVVHGRLDAAAATLRCVADLLEADVDEWAAQNR